MKKRVQALFHWVEAFFADDERPWGLYGALLVATLIGFAVARPWIWNTYGW